MGLTRTSCFVVLAVVFFVCASTISNEKENHEEELLLGQLVDPSFDDNLIDELPFDCKLGLTHFEEALAKRHSSLKYEASREIYPRSRSLSRERFILDCLQKRNQFHVSGEVDRSKHGSSNYLELESRRDDVPRRYLQTLIGSPAPGPSPGPAPFQAPDYPALPPKTQFFPPNLVDSETVAPSVKKAASGPDVGDGNKPGSHRRTVVIAIAITASVTFIGVTVLFLCCSGYCRNSKAGRNDERPLLSLSLSEFSFGGVSPKLYPFQNGNAIKDERIGNLSFGNSSTPYTTESSLGGSFNTVHTSSYNVANSGNRFKPSDMPTNTNAQVNSHLQPPPVRVFSTLPPLKPPPGRAEPLPPEPPSSFKPPSARPGPPIPPPPIPPPSLKPSGVTAPPPPPPPRPSPPPPPPIAASRPPPPPKGGAPRPPPPGAKLVSRPPPPVKKHQANASSSSIEASSDDESDAPKAKLKPFFWDKVSANPDQSMVWHQIKSGSFQFDENMIESLFGYGATEKNKSEPKKESSSQDPSPQFIQIIDAKKAQNLAILLRALNVTIEEVCDALREGHELPSELVENLLKMAPTADEERKLRLFNGDPSQLGTAERFLKALVDIPSAFKRLQALLFMSTLAEELAIVKESFETLEVACKELRHSRLFLKLLEAVLKTGNRMNDGTFRGGAQAFRLDTLLKLADVRGTDGKTTLLHFVVQEIIRSEGIRAVRVAKEDRSLSSVKSDDLLEEALDDAEDHYRGLGLQAVSNLGNELENVKKASVLDAESLTGTVAKFGQSLLQTRKFLNDEMKSLEEKSGFHQTLGKFVENAELEVLGILEAEKRIMALVKSTGDYFHGSAGKDEGLRLFITVRDFLIMVDKSCREVRDAPRKPKKAPEKETSSSDLHQLATPPPSSSDTRQSPVDLRERLFPAIMDRRTENSSSDDEN